MPAKGHATDGRSLARKGAERVLAGEGSTTVLAELVGRLRRESAA